MNAFAREKTSCIERLDNLLFDMASKIRNSQEHPGYVGSETYKSDIVKIDAHYKLLFARLTGNMGDLETYQISKESDQELKPLLAEKPPQ